MARPHPSPTTDDDRRDESATRQQELYGRRAPADLDEANIGREPDGVEDEDPNPGRGEDASGRPSTARSGANTQ
ncbi:MAG: hypothetical protein JF586_18765 [Burkholderiales bacterium]|nr:hypothetical protein [Burkholderiales bacterium]